MQRAWTLLHLFFAFGFVGTLVVADWNSRAARATDDWGRRAMLFDIVARSSRIAGFGSLLMLGVLGNLLATQLGYRMAADAWLRWINGLWLAAVLTMLIVCVPGARRLESIARAAAAGDAAEGYPAALARWRMGNAVLSVLYMALLAFMVFRWKG